MSHLSQYKRTNVADLISPINGYRGQLKTKGITLKDHMKDNYRLIRKTEENMKNLKSEKEIPPPELYKLPEYRHIESKVFQPSDTSPRTKHQFLSKNESKRRQELLANESRILREQLNEQQAEYSESIGRKAPVPRPDESVLSRTRSEKDFISENKSTAFVRQTSSPREEDEDNIKVHSDFGRVPEYLERHKIEQQYEKEVQQRNRRDPDCPPGMTLLSEDERLNMLNQLNSTRIMYLNQLKSIPFIVETPSQIRRQQELESNLRQVEKSISMFSRPKVYVQS